MSKIRALLYLLISRHWVLVISQHQPEVKKIENGGNQIVAENSFAITSRREQS